MVIISCLIVLKFLQEIVKFSLGVIYSYYYMFLPSMACVKFLIVVVHVSFYEEDVVEIFLVSFCIDGDNSKHETYIRIGHENTIHKNKITNDMN